MTKASASQLATCQSLVWQLSSLGDRAWAIRADILVACGTCKLAQMSAATVERINKRLRSRVGVLERLNETKKAGN